MRFITTTLLAALFVLSATQVQAQGSSLLKEAIRSAVEKMSTDNKMEVLRYARSLEKPFPKEEDYDKELKKALKKLPLAEQNKVLEYARAKRDGKVPAGLANQGHYPGDGHNHGKGHNHNHGKPKTSITRPNTPAKPAGPATSIKFDDNVFDFGSIEQGEKVSHTYKFKNTGKKPLVISNARGSCGCTVPKWPKEPIPPGGTGEIQVTFDSKGKKGKQTKTVTIMANTEPANTLLRVTGEIFVPKN